MICFVGSRIYRGVRIYIWVVDGTSRHLVLHLYQLLYCVLSVVLEIPSIYCIIRTREYIDSLTLPHKSIALDNCLLPCNTSLMIDRESNY